MEKGGFQLEPVVVANVLQGNENGGMAAVSEVGVFQSASPCLFMKGGNI